MRLKAGQFYGKTSQTLATSGFRFTEKSYLSRLKLPSHAHELSHFCFVLAGNYQEKIGSKNYERQPMALVFYPPEISHAEEHFTDGRHFLLEIDVKGLNKVREYGARLTETSFLNSDSDLSLAARMYREFSERDEFTALALESMTTELLIAASRKYANKAERQAPPWLEKAKEFLRENYCAPPR